MTDRNLEWKIMEQYDKRMRYLNKPKYHTPLGE